MKKITYGCLAWEFKDGFPKVVHGFFNFQMEACGSREESLKTIF